MPRYFFDIVDGKSLPDDTGVRLAGSDAARDEALRLLGGCVGEQPDILRDHRDWRVEVRNEAGNVLFSVSVLFSDLADFDGDGRPQLPFALQRSDALQ